MLFVRVDLALRALFMLARKSRASRVHVDDHRAIEAFVLFYSLAFGKELPGPH